VKFLKWQDASPEQRTQHLMNVYGNGKGWTTDPPTEEGWYWVNVKYQQNFQEKTKVVMLYCNEQGLFQHSPDDYEFFPDEKNFIHWLGPLPVPESPK
jgi:hypothetical protein